MMKQGKWQDFQKSDKYGITDLGRPAVFMIPTKKLQKKLEQGKTIKTDLQKFLSKNFGAYSLSPIPGYFGVWIDNERVIYDKCTEFKVSFLGKEKISLVMTKLADIAKRIGEKCIYLEAGQYACLVCPK